MTSSTWRSLPSSKLGETLTIRVRCGHYAEMAPRVCSISLPAQLHGVLAACALQACGGRLPPEPSATDAMSDSANDAPDAASPTCEVTGVQPDAPWPMAGGNPGRTGRSFVKGPRTNTLRWSFSYGNNFSSSPAVGADGTVYVGNLYASLFAIAPDGREKWHYAKVDPYGAVAIGCEGVLLMGGEQHTSLPDPEQELIVAINPDGTKRWGYSHTTTFGSFDNSPVPAPNGRVIHAVDGLYGFRLDGGLDWTLGIDSPPRPIVRPDGITLSAIWNGDSGSTVAVAPDGGIVWKDATRGGPWGLLAPDGMYYVGGKSQGLTAFRPNGEIAWTLSIAVVAPMALSSAAQLYVPTNGGLERLDLGSMTRRTLIPGPLDDLYPTVVIDGEDVAYFSYHSTITALRPDGGVLFIVDLGALGDKVDVTSPALGDGVLYVAAYQHLFAIGGN